MDNAVHGIEVDIAKADESLKRAKGVVRPSDDPEKQQDTANNQTQIDAPQIQITIDENGTIIGIEEKMTSFQNAYTAWNENRDQMTSNLNEEGEDNDVVFDNVTDYNHLEDNFALSDGNSLSVNVERVENANVETQSEPKIEKDMFCCNICNKILTRQYYLTSHTVAVHSIGCIDCNIVNYETEAWKAGVKANDKRHLACSGCGKQLVLHSRFGSEKKNAPADHKRTRQGGGFQITTNGLYMCTECGKMSLGKTDCEQHQLIHTASKPSTCHLCGQSYQAKLSLRKHLKLVHKIMMKKGDLIDIVEEASEIPHNKDGGDDGDDDAAIDNETSVDYEDDYNVQDDDEFAASNDDEGNVTQAKGAAQSESIIQTKESEQQEKYTYDCQICGRQMANEYNFRGHLVATHTIGCLDCFTVNAELEPWSENMKAQDKREIPCSGCSKTLVLWTQLGYNENRTKLGGGWKKLDNGMYLCIECGKLFLRRVDCRDHQTTHKETQYYTCKICKKKYSFHTSLRVHMRDVHGIQLKKAADREVTDNNVDLEEIALDVKEKVVPSASNIGAVSDIWSDEWGAEKDEPVDFDLDEYVEYALGGELPKKEKTKIVYGGEKYECTLCSKFFGTDHQFKKHLKRAHGEYKVRCNVCKKNFREQKDLDGHYFNIHKIMCLSCYTVNSETDPWPDEDYASATRYVTCTGCSKTIKLTNKPGPKTVKTTKGGGMFKKLPEKGHGCLECGKVFLSPFRCKRHKSVHTKQK